MKQNDVTRYELQLKNLELARKRAENTLEILNYDLVTMLGLPVDTVIQPDADILDHSLSLHDLTYWQDLAQDESHAIRQTRMAVRMKSLIAMVKNLKILGKPGKMLKKISGESVLSE